MGRWYRQKPRNWVKYVRNFLEGLQGIFGLFQRNSHWDFFQMVQKESLDFPKNFFFPTVQLPIQLHAPAHVHSSHFFALSLSERRASSLFNSLASDRTAGSSSVTSE